MFQTKAQIVVVDVVITGKAGAARTGLHANDFQVLEDGHPQTVTHFEEHTGSSHTLPATRPTLPPNVFSNMPREKPDDSVTVLLLDSLNTPITDQSTVRLQTLKFLKTLRPGQQIAIFGLSSQLRFIQGFTDDPAALAAAIDRKSTGARLQQSPLLDANADTAASQETAAAMRAVPGGEGDSAAAAVEQFMADVSSARSDARLKITLQAFQALARYLGGIPGRKNVAWFSGAFPVVLFPDLNLSDPSGPQRDEHDEVRKTDALLASAQVALYPIAAEGLDTGSFYSAGTDARQSQQQVAAARQNDVEQRNAAHSAMDELARNTGGKAFYNTNGLKEALANVISNGSHYYTLTYSSPNQASDGRYHKIQVKLAVPGYEVAYRQGYYADNEKKSQAANTKPAHSELLSPLMRPGLPDVTQIPFTVQVRRVSDQPAPNAASDRVVSIPSMAQGGDSPALKGSTTRYTVHFFVAPGILQLTTASSGQHKLSVDAALMVYNHAGRLLNWVVRQLDLEMDATHYAIAVANGVNFSLQVDAPEGSGLLRSGIYDLQSDLAGTLELPLASIVNPAAASSSR